MGPYDLGGVSPVLSPGNGIAEQRAGRDRFLPVFGQQPHGFSDLTPVFLVLQVLGAAREGPGIVSGRPVIPSAAKDLCRLRSDEILRCASNDRQSMPPQARGYWYRGLVVGREGFGRHTRNHPVYVRSRQRTKCASREIVGASG